MAATGTPTPNLGLRIPVGTDPASVDDINYNSNLLDTVLGAVGNISVKDQLDELSDQIANRDIMTKFNICDFNYDNPPDRGIITYADSSSTGTKPDSVTGSNSNIVISYVLYNGNLITYGVQIAFGFSDNRCIAIRNHKFGTSNTWSTWTAV